MRIARKYRRRKKKQNSEQHKGNTSDNDGDDASGNSGRIRAEFGRAVDWGIVMQAGRQDQTVLTAEPLQCR